MADSVLMLTLGGVKGTLETKALFTVDESANYDSKRVHLDNLYRMVGYCENPIECRRVQQLAYFGERFDKEMCKQNPRAMCDNCSSKVVYKKKDVTEDCRYIVQSIKEITEQRRNSNITLLHCVDIFRGSQNAKVLKLGHDKTSMFNKGQAYSRNDCERLFRKLILDGVLREDLQLTAADTLASYMKLGTRARDFLSGKMQVLFELRASGSQATRTNAVGKEVDTPQSRFKEQCYNELADLAKIKARENGIYAFTSVFSAEALQKMAEKLPITKEDMLEIGGVTEYKFNRFDGEEFLNITRTYMTINEFDEEMEPDQDGGTEEIDGYPSDEDTDEETSKFFPIHEPGNMLGQGTRRGRGGFKGKRKFGNFKKKKAGSKRTKAASARGRGSGGSGRTDSGGGNGFSQFSYKRGTSCGRGSSTSTKRPGFLNISSGSRSFLGGAAYTLK